MAAGGLLIGISVTLGPVVGLMHLLNLRDRRESALQGVVLQKVNSRDLRGLIAFQIRCAFFSRRSLVALDMRACSRDQIWDVITRLSQSLPPRVRLVVDGTGDRHLLATLTVETAARHPRCRPSCPSVATG